MSVIRSELAVRFDCASHVILLDCIMTNLINKHLQYITFDNKQDETWFNYTFHINGDRNRQVKLAVMLYHLPK